MFQREREPVIYDIDNIRLRLEVKNIPFVSFHLDILDRAEEPDSTLLSELLCISIKGLLRKPLSASSST